jgi:hypothetical protein
MDAMDGCVALLRQLRFNGRNGLYNTVFQYTRSLATALLNDGMVFFDGLDVTGLQVVLVKGVIVPVFVVDQYLSEVLFGQEPNIRPILDLIPKQKIRPDDQCKHDEKQYYKIPLHILYYKEKNLMLQGH